MGFIKNIQICKNEIPRVCSFDYEDYISTGWVGNSCRNFNNRDNNYNNLCLEYVATTARATRNAYFKSIEDLFNSIYAFYFNKENTPLGIPASENNNCITPAKRQAFLDAYWGPDGLKEKLFNVLFIKQEQIFNAMYPECSNDKKQGVISYDIQWQYTYDSPNVTRTYTIDYTNYQNMNYYIMDEYELAFKNLIQEVKNTLIKLTNAPLNLS